MGLGKRAVPGDGRPAGRVLQHPLVVALTVLLLGVAITSLVAHLFARDSAAAAAQRLALLAARASRDVEARMGVNEQALRSLRGMVEAAGAQNVSHRTFQAYMGTLDLALKLPGVRGIGMIRRLVASDETTFVAAMRQEGQPDFRIRGGLRGKDRYVIQFIEPQGSNAYAAGFDIASDPVSRAAAEQSMRSGAAALSAPISISNGHGSTVHSMLLLLPMPSVGWIYAPLTIENVLKPLDLGGGQVSLSLFDVAVRDPSAIFSTARGEPPAVDGLESRTAIRIYGRTWEAVVRTKPSFYDVQGPHDPRAIMTLGAPLSVLLAALVFAWRAPIARSAAVLRAAPGIDPSPPGTAVESACGVESIRKDLRTILDAMPAMIAYWDKNLINRFANRAQELWLGAEPGTLPGKHLRQFLGEARFEKDRVHVEAALRGVAQSFEQSIPQRDGLGYRHCITHYVPDVAEADVRGFYVLVHDVTELTDNRLRYAAALRENEALLRTLDLHSNVSVTDDKARIIEVNDNFCRMLGYGRDELLGCGHDIVNSGAHNRLYWSQMWDTITAGKVWRGNICNRAKDGSLHWVDSIIVPFLGNGGRVEKYISIATDITAARNSEQRLRSSEAFLDRIGSVAGVGGWEMDVRSRSVTWSLQTYQIHEQDPGYTPHIDAEIDFYAHEAHPAIENALLECIENGTPWDLELPAVTSKGRPIWVRTVGAAELHEGKSVRLIGAVQDVTARKTIEMQLQESSERFAIAADSAGIGVWELDAAGEKLIWDDWMYRIYGQTKSRDIESFATWLDAVHPEDRQEFAAEIAGGLRGLSDVHSEFRITRPGGDVRYIKAAFRAVRNDDGTCLRMTGVNFDVTDARRAEMAEMVARRETDSLLRTVLDAASEVSIIATDADLTIKVFNAGAERLLGYTSMEMVGVETLLRIHEAADAIVGPSTLRRQQNRIYVRKDGNRITVSLFVTAMHSDEGDVLGYVCVAHDISQQIQDQRALLDAMSEAERANDAKSLFLANMSHEIRTPMNAVIGLSYLLGHTSLTAEQSSFLGKIQTASNSLLSIITNILDLSKIEAGELLVESAAFNLPGLLREVSAVMAVPAQTKGITFTLEARDDLPAVLIGDSTRLKQILMNLLSNAIRFTDHGGVTFAVHRRLEAATGVSLAFVVSDTGIGIAAEAQATLFAPFAQADASIARRYGGTGLGLSIVKQLVKLLGGTVELESAAGVGSTFTVVLNLLPAAPDAIAGAQVGTVVHGRGALSGIRALVVDDSDINLEVAKRILELDGVRVSLASDGVEAVERLRSDPAAFDVVFMDVQMPALDGYEATRRIRSELGLTELPIIAVTAGALSSERQRAEEAGMNDFICKPFDSQSLARSILRHVSPSPARTVCIPAPLPLQPPADSTWPMVDGIDSADARSRWCGDVPLFSSMLKRLFEEYGNVTMPDGCEDAAIINRHARFMHKLRGAACMLGAKVLSDLAGQIEGACFARDMGRACRLTMPLADELQRVRHGARSLLNAASDPARESPRPAGIELTPELVDEFRSLLEQQSLAAVERFQHLGPQLREFLGDACYDRLRTNIDNLQFEQASHVLLDAHGRKAAPKNRRAELMKAAG